MSAKDKVVAITGASAAIFNCATISAGGGTPDFRTASISARAAPYSRAAATIVRASGVT